MYFTTIFFGGGDFKHCYTMHLLYFCYSLYLAALHFNENVARPQSRIKEGEQQYCVSNPKDRKGEIVAKKIKADQSFSKLNATCKYIVNFFSLSWRLHVHLWSNGCCCNFANDNYVNDSYVKDREALDRLQRRLLPPPF